jgi:hypothetical protein
MSLAKFQDVSEPRSQIPLGKPARSFLVTHISVATPRNNFMEVSNNEQSKKMMADTVMKSSLNDALAQGIEVHRCN